MKNKKKFEELFLPNFTRVFPTLLAKDLVGVQPMGVDKLSLLDILPRKKIDEPPESEPI